MDSDGDAVVLVGKRLWLFNPAALTLETGADGAQQDRDSDDVRAGRELCMAK